MIDLKEIFLLESNNIRGEWWITDTGESLFADGDIGDMGHAAYVIDMVSRDIIGMFNLDCNDEYCALAEEEDNIFEEIKDDLSEDQIERWKEGEEYLVMAEHLGLEGEELKDFNLKIQVIMNVIDPRDYCMEHMGWIRVIDDKVQVWKINHSILKNIGNGLYESYSGELDPYMDVDEEYEGQPTFDIEVLSTRTMFNDVPWAVINAEKMDGLLHYREKY